MEKQSAKEAKNERLAFRVTPQTKEKFLDYVEKESEKLGFKLTMSQAFSYLLYEKER